jgi:large subunit ribosomal protein L15
MPLQRRLPKRGFKNPFRIEYEVVNVRDLNRFEPETVVTVALLREARLVRRRGRPVKILGEGDLDRPLVVQAQAFSRQAKEKIEAAHGRAEVI